MTQSELAALSEAAREAEADRAYYGSNTLRPEETAFREAAAELRTLRAERDAALERITSLSNEYEERLLGEVLNSNKLLAALAERDAAVQAEVAAIVAWLRGAGGSEWLDPDCADAIERGEYKESAT